MTVAVPYRTNSVQTMATTKTTRIELRASARSARRIRYAAELAHQSMSSFMLSAAQERAEQIIATSKTTVVPATFFDDMWKALDAPPRPNAALMRRAQGERSVEQR